MKIVVFNLISLDGYFEGKNHDISWHNVDNEFNEFAIKQTAQFGAIIFGRTTYELMRGYWPTEQEIKDDPIVANQMNLIPKIVFSKSLKEVKETKYWKNIELFHSIKPQDVKKWKKEAKKPIAIFGSGTIVDQFSNLGLVDEYRLLVNPVVLGEGTPLFKSSKKFNLKLVSIREFKNGNVLLTYVPK